MIIPANGLSTFSREWDKPASSDKQIYKWKLTDLGGENFEILF